MNAWDDLFEELSAFGEWASRIREREGFVWLGTCEADPRKPGGVLLVWGRDHDDGLYVAVWSEQTHRTLSWESITDEEWTERYPHAGARPHLPAEDCVEL